jgi:hypothetical protein
VSYTPSRPRSVAIRLNTDDVPARSEVVPLSRHCHTNLGWPEEVELCLNLGDTVIRRRSVLAC